MTRIRSGSTGLRSFAAGATAPAALVRWLATATSEATCACPAADTFETSARREVDSCPVRVSCPREPCLLSDGRKVSAGVRGWGTAHKERGRIYAAHRRRDDEHRGTRGPRGQRPGPFASERARMARVPRLVAAGGDSRPRLRTRARSRSSPPRTRSPRRASPSASRARSGAPRCAPSSRPTTVSTGARSGRASRARPAASCSPTARSSSTSAADVSADAGPAERRATESLRYAVRVARVRLGAFASTLALAFGGSLVSRAHREDAVDAIERHGPAVLDRVAGLARRMAAESPDRAAVRHDEHRLDRDARRRCAPRPRRRARSAPRGSRRRGRSRRRASARSPRGIAPAPRRV